MERIPVTQTFVGRGASAFAAYMDIISQIRATDCWHLNEPQLRELVYERGLWPKTWNPDKDAVTITLHGDMAACVADDPKYRNLIREAA